MVSFVRTRTTAETHMVNNPDPKPAAAKQTVKVFARTASGARTVRSIHAVARELGIDISVKGAA